VHDGPHSPSRARAGPVPRGCTPVSAYQRLSAGSAKARRDGWFPRLVDEGRSVDRAAFWADVSGHLADAAGRHRLDRTAGQPYAVFIGAEKVGARGLLRDWFDNAGFYVAALGGYGSQSLLDELADLARAEPRPAVYIYAGDWDEHGRAIEADFVRRINGAFAEIRRVALTPEQIERHRLPPNPERPDQWEVEALDLDLLRAAYMDAVADYWDRGAHQAVLAEEERQSAELRRLVDGGAA
jgi:hypothetical protein